MELAFVLSLQDHYRDYPPVHITVAQFMGVKPKERPKKRAARAGLSYEEQAKRDREELQELARLIGMSGGNSGQMPLPPGLG